MLGFRETLGSGLGLGLRLVLVLRCELLEERVRKTTESSHRQTLG